MEGFQRRLRRRGFLVGTGLGNGRIMRSNSRPCFNQIRNALSESRVCAIQRSVQRNPLRTCRSNSVYPDMVVGNCTLQKSRLPLQVVCIAPQIMGRFALRQAFGQLTGLHGFFNQIADIVTRHRACSDTKVRPKAPSTHGIGYSFLKSANNPWPDDKRPVM